MIKFKSVEVSDYHVTLCLPYCINDILALYQYSIIVFNLHCNCSFLSLKRLETCILTFIYLIKQLLNLKK